MSVSMIPSKTIRLCDCCGNECVGPNYIHEGRLTLTRAALDFQGCPVADASIKLDLCDRCNDKIGDAINAAARSIKP